MAINATQDTRELATTTENVVIVYPFEYVEGMLGATIASIYHAVDSMRPEHQAKLSMTRIENGTIAESATVRGVPTTIIYENNVEMERVVGFEDVSKLEKRFNIYIEPK